MNQEAKIMMAITLALLALYVILKKLESEKGEIMEPEFQTALDEAVAKIEALRPLAQQKDAEVAEAKSKLELLVNQLKQLLAAVAPEPPVEPPAEPPAA